MKTENSKTFKIAFGTKDFNHDVIAPNCKFTFKEDMIDGENQIIPNDEQTKHGLHFEILESHQENGINCIDKVKLISGSVLK